MRSVVFNTVFLVALLGACLNATEPAAVGWEVTEAIAADQFKAKLRIKNGSGAVLHVSLGPDQRLLTLVMADGTVRLWDLNAGVQRAVIPAADEAPSVATPISDAAVVLGDRRGRVFIVDLKAGASRRLLGTHGDAVEAVAISRDGKTLVTADAGGQAIAWSLEARKLLAVFEEHRASIRVITISNDATRVATGDSSGSVALWSPDSGRVIATLARAPGAVLALRFLDDAESVVVASRRGSVETIEVSSGDRLRYLEVPRRGLTGLAINRSGDRVAVGYGDDGLRVYDLAGDRASRELRHDDGAVGPLVFLAGSQHLLSTGRNGIARIWDLETGDVLLRIISTENGWTILGRQGRFDGSEQGIDNLSWEANDEDFALDRFSEEYFEPGLLASYLRDESEFAIRDPVSIEDGITLPPRVTIASLEPTSDGKLIVVVTAEDRGGGIEEIRLYHNGKLVAPASLVEQRDVRQVSQHIRAAGFALDLVPGPNSFKAISTGTLGIESESQRLTKIMEGSTPASTLHIAAVGLSRYDDPRMNLSFSVSDAEAILSELGGERSTLFSNIREYRLFDEEATRSHIVELLASFSETKPQDVLVFYLAGHGTVVGKEWYFLPYDARYEKSPATVPPNSLSATEIQEALVTAKAQRVLLMIDSCYSGTSVTAFQNLQRFQRRFLRSLSRITGVTVLAATRQDQVAREVGRLGHGIFTYVVLAGLKGEADTRPIDGRITAHELVGHSIESLPTLSRRFYPRQLPQEPMAFALGSDFLLRDLRAQP